jgi:thiol-disulfide isomerase/thioredoxin
MTEVTTPANKSTAFYIKRTIGLILLLTLAAVFLFSGLTKIGLGYDHGFYWTYEGATNFTWTFIDMGINSQLWAGVIARVMIGLEFVIAALLLAHIFLKQVTYPLTIGVLIVFTVYLIIQVMMYGKEGNCGCFGEDLPMTPLNAIWKNLGMIAITASLYFLYPVKPYKHQEWISVVVAMIAIVIPFIVDPISSGTTPKTENKPINMDALYAKDTIPSVELRQGKHIVAFMSLTCPHCRKAAKKLAIVHKKNPQIPIFMVLAGNPDNKKKFFDDTKSEDVPYVMFRDPEEFLKMAGSGVPAIFYINNNVIERDANYFQLDPGYMLEWLGK